MFDEYRVPEDRRDPDQQPETPSDLEALCRRIPTSTELAEVVRDEEFRASEPRLRAMQWAMRCWGQMEVAP